MTKDPQNLVKGQQWAMCLFLMFHYGDLLLSMGGEALIVTVVHGTSCEIQMLDTLEECFVREREEELSKVL
jgi:hypothetical protein